MNAKTNTALKKKQAAILNTPERKLAFAPPKIETEVVSVRIRSELMERLRKISKEYGLVQQDFFDLAVEEMLKRAEDEVRKKLAEMEAQKPKKRRA